MKVILTGFLISFFCLAAGRSYGQIAATAIGKDTMGAKPAVKSRPDSIPSKVYNDLPRMPKKKEPSAKLLIEDKKQIKKSQVKRRYKKEKRSGVRVAKREDNRHGIMAERKRKDRMFK